MLTLKYTFIKQVWLVAFLRLFAANNHGQDESVGYCFYRIVGVIY